MTKLDQRDQQIMRGIYLLAVVGYELYVSHLIGSAPPSHTRRTSIINSTPPKTKKYICVKDEPK